MLRESQTEKDKDCTISLISRIIKSATIQSVKQKRSRITDREQPSGYPWKGEREAVWRMGNERYKLLGVR